MQSGDVGSVDPLDTNDVRMEQLFFPDGSGITVDQHMRTHARPVYLDACRKAINREFVDKNRVTGECALCHREIAAHKMFCDPCIAMEAGKQGRKL